MMILRPSVQSDCKNMLHLFVRFIIHMEMICE